MRREDRVESEVIGGLVIIGNPSVRRSMLGHIERTHPRGFSMERDARSELLKFVNAYPKQVDVLYKGNTVWRVESLVSAMRLIVKSDDVTKMTDYLYKFLSLACGSIAHYNKAGWVGTYPTVADLRDFFLRNEFGQRVREHVPYWHTDAKVAVAELEKVLGVE